jgi:hypothetical protein
LLEAGAAHALAVLDPESGEIRTGVAGLAWLGRGTRLAPVAWLLGRSPLRLPAEVAYRFVARHRRALFRPRAGSARCACGAAG